MKAVLCKAFGPPETLVIEDVAEPRAGAGEIVVEVAAAALNFFDTLIIRDKYQYKPELPFSPGAEFAGTVIETGEGVDDLAPGDRVVAYCTYGAVRERVAVAAAAAVRLPDAVSFDKAAGLMITYGTTLHALKDRGRLRPGETLAVLGASGGVGIAAVEIGKLMGAEVIACASSRAKLDFCVSRGADRTIDYSARPLRDALKEATGGRGADVVYDPVGGDFSEAALRATAWKGRFLVVGFAAGEIPRIPLNLALLKGCDICGVFWGNFTQVEPAAHRENCAQLVAWCADGSLDVPIHGVYGLEETAKALAAFERREVAGKVIIRP